MIKHSPISHLPPLFAGPLSFSRFPAVTSSWLSWTTNVIVAPSLQLPWSLLRSSISFPELLVTILAPICFSVIIMEKCEIYINIDKTLFLSSSI